MFNPETPPELSVTRWLNTKEPITLKALKGKVVILVAFQMLCPGCVSQGLPQAKRLRERFNPDQVAVIALHTVFENHEVMTEKALEVFQNEYNWPFPIGIDQPDGKNGPPKTFATYSLQGTPSLLVFDRAGRLRRHYFGNPDDIRLAAEIMALSIEDKGGAREQAAAIEHKLAATLVMPEHHHHHDHDHEHGDACGCGHDHDHDHHHHDHDHGHHHHGHDHHHHDHGHGSKKS